MRFGIWASLQESCGLRIRNPLKNCACWVFSVSAWSLGPAVPVKPEKF